MFSGDSWYWFNLFWKYRIAVIFCSVGWHESMDIIRSIRVIRLSVDIYFKPVCLSGYILQGKTQKRYYLLVRRLENKKILINLNTWFYLETRMLDEFTMWRLIIVTLKDWKSSDIWENQEEINYWSREEREISNMYCFMTTVYCFNISHTAGNSARAILVRSSESVHHVT